MIQSSRLPIALLFSISLTAFASVAPPADWVEVNRDELITVYKKEISGSDVLAVKGVGTLNAPFARILDVALDAVHRSEWMEQVKSVIVLEEVSANERIEYWHLSPPWPIRDRDLVIRETMEMAPSGKSLTLRMKSIDYPAYPPRSDRIRAELYDATFVVTSVEDGSKTALIAESHADPKGSIPKWVVNIYQKDMPTKSIRRLLRRAEDSSVTASSAIRELLQRPSLQGRL